MRRMIGKKTWIIPDGFLQPKSTGDQISHEAVCVLNLTKENAKFNLHYILRIGSRRMILFQNVVLIEPIISV